MGQAVIKIICFLCNYLESELPDNCEINKRPLTTHKKIKLKRKKGNLAISVPS